MTLRIHPFVLAGITAIACAVLGFMSGNHYGYAKGQSVTQYEA
jgi:hypothetical protein